MSAMWSRIRESRAGIAATVAVIAAVLLVPFGYTCMCVMRRFD